MDKILGKWGLDKNRLPSTLIQPRLPKILSIGRPVLQTVYNCGLSLMANFLCFVNFHWMNKYFIEVFLCIYSEKLYLIAVVYIQIHIALLYYHIRVGCIIYLCLRKYQQTHCCWRSSILLAATLLLETFDNSRWQLQRHWPICKLCSNSANIFYNMIRYSMVREQKNSD